MRLTSSAFEDGGMIPDRYSKQGGNISPPLKWTGVPDEAVSLALVVEDPDAPSGLVVHWLVYGIDPKIQQLDQGLPVGPELPNGARQGSNVAGEFGYTGPKPPSGTHRYFFHLYALDTETDLPPGMSREEVYGVIHGHILAEAELMGRYPAKGESQQQRGAGSQ